MISIPFSGSNIGNSRIVFYWSVYPKMQRSEFRTATRIRSHALPRHVTDNGHFVNSTPAADFEAKKGQPEVSCPLDIVWYAR